MTHSSGIYNFTDEHYMKDLGDKPYSQHDFWSCIRDKALEFTPGAKFEYSNSNYMILGYLIQAAGGMYTTAGDLYRWSKALYTNSIVSQASLEEAFTPYMGNYGYGWYIETGAGGRNMAHNGGIWGFEAQFKRFPDDHGCIILLRNEMRGFEDYALSLHRIYNHDPNYYIPRKEIAVVEDSLRAFTGVYELTGKPEFKATILLSDGHLFLTWTKMATAEIYAEKKDFFHFKVYNMQLAFIRDEKAKITGFSAIGNGQTFVYKKL